MFNVDECSVLGRYRKDFFFTIYMTSDAYHHFLFLPLFFLSPAAPPLCLCWDRQRGQYQFSVSLGGTCIPTQTLLLVTKYYINKKIKINSSKFLKTKYFMVSELNEKSKEQLF